MMLYEDEKAFKNALRAVSERLNVSEAIVEKDYFVTLLLNEIVDAVPGIMFKGGTCLSKCFKLIDRFSEDIDLTLDEEHFTQGNKRNANKAILSICDKLGFSIRNRDVVERHSHGSYNCYEIEYPRSEEYGGLIPHIKLELVFIQKAFPSTVRTANSLIGETLSTPDNVSEMKKFGLDPFEIRVQSLERTFVDKVFAICDYYLRGESLRQSRHIYDIHRLYQVIDETNLKRLINSVRDERKKNKTCLSAADGVDVNSVIREFVENEFFLEDFQRITSLLLSKKVDYEEAIETLVAISNSDLFE